VIRLYGQRAELARLDAGRYAYHLAGEPHGIGDPRELGGPL
jgi:hypothetical protein